MKNALLENLREIMFHFDTKLMLTKALVNTNTGTYKRELVLLKP